MSEWAARRFWTDVTVEPVDGGHEVRLDGKPIHTPGKRRIVMPSHDMADAVAGEWRAQEGVIDPRTMPWTRSANSALDKVAPQREAVIHHLAGYAATDLLSYRADGPPELVARQAAEWDPLLVRLRDRYDVRLDVTSGVMPVEQDAAALARLGEVMAPMSDFEITGFHDLVTLSGSFVIALAAINEWAGLEELWQASRLDELWQIEQWGADDEAETLAASKRRDFLHAAAFYGASR